VWYHNGTIVCTGETYKIDEKAFKALVREAVAPTLRK